MPPIKEIKPASPSEPSKRAQSGIGYPYFNLDQSSKVAQVIHERGGGACSPDQLASFLDYKTVRSGTFLTRMSAARMFGLINSDGGRVGITDRARAIISPVMPEDSTNAKVDAFLAVPLFAEIYQRFLGQTLPPEVGLRNLFAHQYKIVPDRIGPALRVFYESAEQAGFFALSGERTKLIKPIVRASNRAPDVAQAAVAQTPEARDTVPDKPRGGSGGGDGPSSVHPAIVGLLRELPQAGQTWARPMKERFLKAFQTTIDFIYPDEGEGSAS